MASADFTADGLDDLAVGCLGSTSSIEFLAGTGAAADGSLTHLGSVSSAAEPRSILLFAGTDGRLHLAASANGNSRALPNQIGTASNTGDPSDPFQTVSIIDLGAHRPGHLHATDLNEDGWVDLTYTDRLGSGRWYLPGNASAGFDAPSQVSTSSTTSYNQPLYVDDDGRPDWLITDT